MFTEPRTLEELTSINGVIIPSKYIIDRMYNFNDYQVTYVFELLRRFLATCPPLLFEGLIRQLEGFDGKNYINA